MLASMSPTKQFALGTRYAKGVEIDEGWPLYRRVISSGARMLALPLTSASDPMSGFFGIRREQVRLCDLLWLARVSDGLLLFFYVVYRIVSHHRIIHAPPPPMPSSSKGAT